MDSGEAIPSFCTSVGANIEEAQAGESRADFIHKYRIALKESREVLYWLRLLDKSNLVSSELLIYLLQETDELIATLTSIINWTRNNSQ